MKVESIAEYGILQYFWPALSNYWTWKPILVFLRVAVLHKFLLYLFYNNRTTALERTANIC